MHRYNVTDSGGNVAKSVNQDDRYGRSDSDRITRRGTRFVRQIIAAITDSVPFNRVVMPSYITLKTNKIGAICPRVLYTIYIKSKEKKRDKMLQKIYTMNKNIFVLIVTFYLDSRDLNGRK